MYDPATPGTPAQDVRRIPPETSRQDALGRLRRERWFAADAGESARVAELDAQIERLSAASTPVSPRRETTSAKPARAEQRATTPRKGNHGHR